MHMHTHTPTHKRHVNADRNEPLRKEIVSSVRSDYSSLWSPWCYRWLMWLIKLLSWCPLCYWMQTKRHRDRQRRREIGRDTDSKGTHVSNHCDLSFLSSGTNCAHQIIILHTTSPHLTTVRYSCPHSEAELPHYHWWLCAIKSGNFG